MLTQAHNKSGDWSYCPACGGPIDTGYECNVCGRDWLEYHQTTTAIRAEVEGLKQGLPENHTCKHHSYWLTVFGNCVMCERENLTAQLAARTQERD